MRLLFGVVPIFTGRWDRFTPALKEIDYIEKYDRLTSVINSLLNLPDTRVDLLIKYLDQNNGKLSKRKWQKDVKSALFGLHRFVA